MTQSKTQEQEIIEKGNPDGTKKQEDKGDVDLTEQPIGQPIEQPIEDPLEEKIKNMTLEEKIGNGD
jgi:hypothetical protein